MRKRITLATLGAAAIGLPLVMAGPAQSHGYTSSPPSRSSMCASGAVSDCGGIEYEPQSVEGPKGFPESGPKDGTICAAGKDSWAPLDDPRDGNWPTTDVSSGDSLNVKWKISARHSTTSFRYFVTKDSYDPTKPLKRSDLTKVKEVDMGGAQPGGTVSHQVPMPNRSGHHMLLAVWDIADTGNAFYSCADVKF